MEENLKKYVKALEGITAKEWGSLTIIISNEFSRIKEKNTFSVSKDVFEDIEVISD